MTKPGQTISISRVLQGALLLLLAFYLALSGGQRGLALYPFYRFDVTLIAMGGLGWIAWRIWRRRGFPRTGIDLPLFAWLAVLLLTTLTSVDRRLSAETFVYYLVCALLFYFFVDLQRAGRSIETWIGFTLLAGIWFLTFGYLEVVNWYKGWLAVGDVGSLMPPSTIRVQASMGHPNLLAPYLNLLLPLALVRLLNLRSWLGRIALAFYALMIVGLIYLTSSRGGWVGTAAMLGTLALLLAIDRREMLSRLWGWLKSRRLLAMGLLLIAILLAGSAGWLFYRQAQHPSHPSGNPRGYIWSVAWESFVAQPLTGTGPGTFMRLFLNEFSIPPDDLMAHAHNFPLNQLAESGFLGFAACLWLGITIALLAVRRWRNGQPGKRERLAGSIAALVGLAAASQFEVPQISPLVNVLTIALVVELLPAKEHAGDLRQRAGAVLIALGWLAAAGLGAYSLWGFSAFQRGLDAAGVGNWLMAAQGMEEAARRDPSLAYYHFQAGLANGRLALSPDGEVIDPDRLDKAIQALERGLEIESDYAMNWANLGLLRRGGGDLPGGVTALERAEALAPRSAEISLLLGDMLEEAGQADAALVRYARALELKPDLAGASFFQATPLRQMALAAFSPPALDEGWLALERGDYPQAEAFFRGGSGLNDAGSFLGLGLALAGQGRSSEAGITLRTAAFIDPADGRVQAALAKLYDQTGQAEPAAEARDGAISAAAERRKYKEIPYQLAYHRMGMEFYLLLSFIGWH